MPKTQTLFTFALLLLFALACSAGPAPDAVSAVPTVFAPADFTPPLLESDVPRVSLEDAKAAFDNGTAVIVDVRSRDSFNASHIPGALNIQLGEFETDPGGTGLPKDQWIITYCT